MIYQKQSIGSESLLRHSSAPVACAKSDRITITLLSQHEKAQEDLVTAQAFVQEKG